jgi:TATA-binding protein-associated factor
VDAAAFDVATGMEKLKLLHQHVLPFILRREKDQVLKELPPKIVTKIPCMMSPLQEELCHKFYSAPRGKRSLSALQKSLEDSDDGNSTASSMDSDVLKSLLYLRLLSTHPWLVRGEQQINDNATKNRIYKLEASGKLMALRELLRDAGIHGNELTAADNDSSLLYCEEESNDAVDEYQQSLDAEYDDSMDVEEQERNGRKGSRCLIFAQFMHSLDIVEELLLKRYMPSEKYLRLDGRVPASKRSEIVNKFNNDESIKILLLTTKIGGLGLNLTGADTVIFLEHDWNPHTDLQAMDRAHRIGQKKTVHVYQLVTMNSIEEKTMILHEKKMAMSAAIVNTDNSSLYSMGTDRLLDIFQVRSEAASSSAEFEDTLDSLVERYEDEYQSLSVCDFVKSFKDK